MKEFRFLFSVLVIGKMVCLTNWNYTNSGTDWIGNNCDATNTRLSPINIDLTIAQCDQNLSFDFYINKV